MLSNKGSGCSCSADYCELIERFFFLKTDGTEIFTGQKLCEPAGEMA